MTPFRSIPGLAPLLLTALAGCGGEGPAPPPSSSAALDLLARRPDTVLDEPGLLVPSATAEWGPNGLTGWYKASVQEDPARPRYVPTNQPVAVLDLPATAPRARTIELEMWCPAAPEGTEPRVDVRLNGIDVAKGLVPGPEPARFSIPTPALTWHRGENLLELQASRYGAGTRPDGTKIEKWHTIAVSRVEYGPPRTVTLPEGARRELLLPPSTGVRYFIETGPGARITLGGRASETGELAVQFGSMDPERGSIDEERFPALRIAVPGGPWEEDIPVPSRFDGVLQLELVWSSPSEGSLAIERLAVSEITAHARPPIVFVSFDTFAARHLAMHGYGRETMPNLERFRTEAVVFDRCVANAPWTMPSYLSVLTGLYPRSHVMDLKSMEGLELNNIDLWQVADSRWTMAEMLRGRGYRTAGFVDTAWLSHKFRVAQGFDHYDTDATIPPFSDPSGGIAFVAARLARWLDARPDGAPPFLFLHALDAHGPYWPEFPFKGRFQADLPAEPRMALAGADEQCARALPVWMSATLTGPPAPRRLPCLDHPSRHMVDVVCPDHEVPRFLADYRFPREQSVDEIIARYDESLLKLDSYLGMIFDMLKARGLYDGAMIIVTGDHGESFAHDFYGHGRLWEDIVHVPLLIKMPGGEFAGRRVSRSVELVDLYPTMLEVARGRTERSYLHGRSLLPLMRGEPEPARPTFCEGGHLREYMVELDGWKLIETWPGEESGLQALLTHRRVPDDWLRSNFPTLVGAPFTKEWLAARRTEPDFAPKVAALRKLIRGPFRELYHLPDDPGEEHDLARARPEVVERLRPLLEERRRRGLEASENASFSAFVTPFDEKTLEALNGLGYGTTARSGAGGKD